MKGILTGLFISTGWDAKKVKKALDILASYPGLSDRARSYLEKKLANPGNQADHEILFRALGYTGFTRELYPAGCRYDDVDAVREEQWRLVKALAPCLLNGDILMLETLEKADGILGDDIYYGYRIRDGHAVRLGVSLREIYEAGEKPGPLITYEGTVIFRI